MATTTYERVVTKGDFKVNTYETQNQLSPDVLALSGGGFVAAYNNHDLANGQIVLNFYDADFNVVGSYKSAFANDDTDATGQPKLTQLANGNVLVVWDDNNAVNNDVGPQAAIFTAEGDTVVKDVKLIPTTTSTEYSNVDVAALPEGGFVISYEWQGDIYTRTYTDGGVQVIAGAYTKVNTVDGGLQTDAQITVLADGAYAVSWTDASPSDQMVKARIFEADGTPRTGEFDCSPGDGDNNDSSIAALKNGGFAVAFSDSTSAGNEDGSYGVSLRLVSKTGEVGDWIQVNNDTIASEADADVTVLANGMIAVTWTHPYSGIDKDVYARIFDQAGNAVTDPFAMGSTSSDEIASALDAMVDGRFVTVWQDEQLDGSLGRISGEITELVRKYVGDNGANNVTGDLLRDSLFGGEGADTLNGLANHDSLDGAGGSDSLNGGNGNDVIQGGHGADTILGGVGNDKIFAMTSESPLASAFGDLISGEAGNDRVTGANGADTIDGGVGDDLLMAGGGADELLGGDGADELRGGEGNDTLEGGLGKDSINGSFGHDLIYAGVSGEAVAVADAGNIIYGGNGNDTVHGAAAGDAVSGGAGRDFLFGNDGADTLGGGAGDDVLRGGADSDIFYGEDGKDTFDFDLVSDSAASGGIDLIADLQMADVINLAGIDADTGADGNQKFRLVDAFSGDAGELTISFYNNGLYAGMTTIQGDVDGDGAADLLIRIQGDMHTFENFVL